MKKITICIPSKSNLRYLKMAIPSIRKNAANPSHDIIIYVDEDNDGTREWLEANTERYNLKVLVNPNIGEKLTGIGKAYDTCVEASETDVFMIGHADMTYCKNFDKNALEHLQEGTVVALTRIEPRLHPNNGEKILEDFGMYPEELLEDKLDEYVEERLGDDKITNGIFAPWMMYKSDHQAIGGHDVRMHSCREDSDIFNRMLLAGYKFVQPWNAFVYHMAGRGAGSFGNADTEEDRIRHDKWKVAMNGSTREFIRKWRSNVKHTALMEPIVNPIYDTAIVITNSNLNLIGALEPWSSDLFTDCDYAPYFESEKYNTVDNLLTKLHTIDEEPTNDVVINIDGRTFTQQDFNMLAELGAIIKQSGKPGRFKLGNFTVKINKIENKQDENKIL